MSKKPSAVPADDWRTRDDLHHLTQAHKIKQDPKRHKAAMDMAKSQIKDLNDATAIQATDPAADA